MLTNGRTYRVENAAKFANRIGTVIFSFILVRKVLFLKVVFASSLSVSSIRQGD